MGTHTSRSAHTNDLYLDGVLNAASAPKFPDPSCALLQRPGDTLLLSFHLCMHEKCKMCMWARILEVYWNAHHYLRVFMRVHLLVHLCVCLCVHVHV